MENRISNRQVLHGSGQKPKNVTQVPNTAAICPCKERVVDNIVAKLEAQDLAKEQERQNHVRNKAGQGDGSVE